VYRRRFALQLLRSPLLWESREPIDIVMRELTARGGVRAFVTEVRHPHHD
jgi:hypothetical protein